MSKPFFSINVDRADIDRMMTIGDAAEGQIERARVRALKKLGKRVENSIKKEAAHRLRIPQKAIADRFFSSKVGEGDTEMTVWIGTWAISPFSIGKPRQLPSGVRAGRRLYRGAWIGSVYGLEEKVWIRLSSPYYSSEIYPTKRSPGDRGKARDHRFPVVRAAVPIDSVIADIINRDGDEFGTQFLKIFEQELNYEVNVKGAN